jgi:hypothetical protein
MPPALTRFHPTQKVIMNQLDALKGKMYIKSNDHFCMVKMTILEELG